jgi:hypothetical protein
LKYPQAYDFLAVLWARGCSSVGRAPEWHSGGRGFDSLQLSDPAGPGGDHRLEIRDRHGKVLASADHSSPDGEHGLVVEQVGWSPDSQFLVYSALSSGGHQPWTTPTHVYDRLRNKVLNLECFLPPTTSDPGFRLRSPDLLTIAVWSPFSQGLAGSIALPVTIHLRDLRKPPAEPAWPECAN